MKVPSIGCGSLGTLLVKNGKAACVAEGLDLQDFL